MSALLGALGLVAILFALASFFMALAGVTALSWSVVHGIIGIVLLGSAAAINLDGLRERLEERFRDFGGSGAFEFRLNDGEPFRFDFPAAGEESPAGDGEILNRSI